MSDVLIAWVTDGDRHGRVHFGLRDTARGFFAGDGARERITLSCLEVVYMNWGGGRVVAESKGPLGLVRFPRKYLHVPAPDRSVLPTLHCFIA